MQGETELGRLLAGLGPRLEPVPHVVVRVTEAEFRERGAQAFAMVREAEGVTLVLPATDAPAGEEVGERWALITLQVHSALTAVGLLAAVTGRLAAAGIPVNAMAGYYHDHLLVPWDRRHEAMALLEVLSAQR